MIGVAFNVMSIDIITDFVIGNCGAWPVLAQSIVILLMLVGGGARSTAGGIIGSRIILLLKVPCREIQRD